MMNRHEKRKKFSLLILLLLFSCISIYAQEPLVTVNLKNASLKEVFSAIEKQTTYRFSYRNAMIDGKKNITIEKTKVGVPTVLKEAFSGRNLDFSVISSKLIVITDKQKDGQSAGVAKKVTGRIMDPNGEPIIGANISIKGTSQGVVTDVDGGFVLEVPENTLLQISYIGYTNKEVPATTKKAMQITLAEDLKLLDEVVVIGFQTQKKVNVTGAITSVGKEVFENRPITNVGEALQGVVPNLNIDIPSGKPDETPAINLRGGTSLSYNQNSGKYEMVSGAPLILADGIEIDAMQLNQMNPNDIANISVLKDLSSAAIYGTRANDGVILITTKSGVFEQKPKITYSYDLSMETPANIPDILDSYTIQRAEMDKKLFTNRGESTDDLEVLEAMAKYRDNPCPENSYFMQGGFIRWVASMNPFDVMVKDWTPTQKHNFSVSGGSAKVNYYISLGYVDKEGMYKYENDEYKRYNASANISAKITNWFNLSAKATYNQTNYKAPFIPGGKGDIWWAMRTDVGRTINSPLLTGPNDPIPNTPTDNVLNYLKGPYSDAKNSTTILTVSPEFIIIPNELKIKADFSYTPEVNQKLTVQPAQARVHNNWNSLNRDHTPDNYAWEDKANEDALILNAYADYNKTLFKKHNISALLGYNQERITYTSLSAFYNKLISPEIINPDAVEDETLNSISNYAHAGTARAVFGRISYDYEQRYLFSVNARYDGSSKFPKDSRFQFFPTFSLGWRISEESFMKSTRQILDNLMIRGSWGKLGSQPGSYYPYQSVLSTGSAGYIVDGSFPGGIYAPGLVSPSISWPETTTINLGLDWTMLNNRLTGTFDFFNKKVDKILTDGTIKYPAVLGASAPLQNSGELKGRGWELVVNWKDNLSCGISYGVGLTLGDSYNEVVQYAGNPEKQLGSLYSGMKIGEIWGYETGGILQEEDFDGKDGKGFPIFNGPDHTAFSSQMFPGMIWYKDLNHDGKINAGNNTLESHGDMGVIGNSSPRYRYGITANLSYKGFDVNMFFDGIGKRDVWIGDSGFWGGGAGSQWMLDRAWRPDRTDAKYPMYMASGVAVQSGYLINGSFFRMKQLVLGYTLPKHITKKIGSDKIRFNLSAYNLFEISGVPDNYSVDNLSSAYPFQRSISLGAQIEF